MATNKVISFEAPEVLAIQLEAYVTEHAANRSAVIRKAITEFLTKETK